MWRSACALVLVVFLLVGCGPHDAPHPVVFELRLRNWGPFPVVASIDTAPPRVFPPWTIPTYGVVQIPFKRHPARIRIHGTVPKVRFTYATIELLLFRDYDLGNAYREIAFQ